MNILHRRFHLIRGGNAGPARHEGGRPAKVPGWLYPVVMVIALAGAVLVLQPAEVLGFGQVHASGEAQPAASAPGSDTAVKSGAMQEQSFDYFPDHYVNQAKEPAEPIATF